MSYDYQAHAREAAALLKKVLPEAVKLAGDAGGTPLSAVGSAFFDHVTVERMQGVHVYRGERGGWFGDLVFRDMPPGITRVIGTPVQLPCRSREEALSQITGMVAMVVAAEKARATKATSGPPVDPVFLIGGLGVSIKSEALAEIANLGRPDEGHVAMRLDEMMSLHAVDGRISKARIRGLKPSDNATFMAVVAQAMILGMVRWPEIPEAAPAPPGPLN